jgi:hypothetical protein
LLDQLREATKSPKLSFSPININIQVPAQPGQAEEESFNALIEPETNVLSIPGDMFEPDTVSLSPPWDMPSNVSQKEYIVGSGMMDLESDWQTYMHQFGMPYIEGDFKSN